jgi:TPR repeat protein
VAGQSCRVGKSLFISVSLEQVADNQGERESLNALGIVYRDGLLVTADPQKAYNYFQAAAGQDLAEAQVNLAKLHLGQSSPFSLIAEY